MRVRMISDNISRIFSGIASIFDNSDFWRIFYGKNTIFQRLILDKPVIAE
jgi:hypothetical protein